MPGLKLMAELGLDGSGFARGFRQARGFMEGAGEGLKHLIIGAIGIATVEEAIRRTVDSAKELVEISERLAIAPKQLQVLRQAAKDSGVEFENLVEAMEKVGIAREKALMPGEEGFGARRAFAGMGIGRDQLHSMTSAQLLLGPIREAILGRNPEEIGIVFRELGIKAFGGLIPLLKTNFDELGKKMEDLGAIMDTDTAVKLKGLSEQFSGVEQMIAVHVGPALLSFVEHLYKAALGLGAFVAGISGFIGGATAGKSPGQAVGSGFAFLSDSLRFGLGLSNQDEYRKSLGKTFDLEAGNKAFREALKPWAARLEEFQKLLERLAKAANDLDNPARGDFSGPALPPHLPKRALETPGDALSRIGSFFGASGTQAAITLAQRRTELLARIERNTSPSLTPHFNKIVMGPNFPHS